MSLNFYLYNIPFYKSLRNSQTSFRRRKGLILEFITGNRTYYGEAAPLPGFSKETLQQVVDMAKEKRKTFLKLFESSNRIGTINRFGQRNEIPPSLAFAIDTIAHQVEAHSHRNSLKDYLFPDAPSRIPVNTLLTLSDDQPLREVRNKMNRGFQTFKFKIGVDFNTELSTLQRIRTEFPAITIRLDANRAWKPGSAARNLQELAELDIEFCEEPLAVASPENYTALKQETRIPLALDESLYQNGNWHKLLPYTDYIIIKPMLLGGFKTILETRNIADTYNNKTIFTTSLESGIGRIFTAILASGMGAEQHAHGLATGFLMEKDLLQDNTYIAGGYYRLGNIDEILTSFVPAQYKELSLLKSVS